MKLQDFDFRIWDKNYKGCNNENCKCQSKFIYGKEAKVRLSEFKDEDVEIELWTRFYDKNHKKIYEGDILKIENKTLVKVEFNLNDGFFTLPLAKKKNLHINLAFMQKAT
ncbi:TPA: YopX family protein [Campylobacter jejuni]